MSSPIYSHRTILPLALGAAFLLALQAMPDLHAANVTWSSAGTSTAGGDGNWTGGSTWWNGSSAVTWTASDNATFSAAGNTTVNSTVTVGKITFSSSTENISILGGAGSITLNAGGITATNTADTAARTFTISESIALGATQTWTVTNGGSTGTANLTVSGVISGGSNISKWGNGTLTLSGNNTFSGGLTMGHNVNNITGGTVKMLHTKALGTGLTVWENDGTIELGANGLTISNAVLIGNRASATDAKRRYRLDLAGSNTGTLSGNFDLRQGSLVLDVGTDDTLTLSGNLSTGANVGGFEKTGAGTAVLTGASNTATGTTVISAGTLQIGAGGTTGTLNTAAVTNNATLVFNRSNALTVSNVISGTGNLTQNGSDTLTLNGSNTYTGTTTVNAGTLAISKNMTIGAITGSGNLSLGSGITLATNASSDTTFSGLISGSGSLTKASTGTLTLTNTNTYNGTTTINGGTLQVDGNIANSGLVINSGATISPGTTAAADSFGTSSITINGGGYNWTLNTANGSAGTDWDQITSTGALTSSGLLTVYLYGTPGDWNGANTYSWDIISAGSVTGFSAGNFTTDFTNFGIAAGNRTGVWTFSNPSSGIIRLTYGALSDPSWAGGTGNWDAGFSPAVSNGDAIYFTGAGGGTATNNIASATLSSLASINFQGTAGAYTLTANSGSAGNGSALTVTGGITNLSSSTQTINMDLGFTSTQSVAATGGDIAIGGVISGSGGLTKAGAYTLTLTGNNTYTGATVINAGTLEIGAAGRLNSGSYSNTISNSGTLIYSGTNNQTLSGVISGSGALTKNGSATLILTANNTYTGGTTVNAGTLQIGAGTNTSAAVAGTTTLSGGTLTYYYSAAKNDVNGAITLTAESTITRSNTHQVMFNSGTLNGGGQTLNVSTEGTDMMRFDQTAGTSLGQVNILKGSVGVGSTNYALRNATINVASGAQFGGTTTGTPLTFNNNITLNGGAGPNGYGALTNHWWGTITYSGSITLASATDSSIGTSYASADPGNGQIIISGQVVGSGSLTKINGQRLTLSGNNTYTGTTTISAGILEIGAAGRLGGGSYSNTITNNGTLIYSGTNAQTLSGVISGTGNLTQNGSGTLTLSGNNTYSGATTISAGTLEIGAAGRLGGGSYAQNISNNATFIYSGTNAQTLSGVISGTGALTKNGTGTLTLSGNNRFNGTTTVSAGTLVLSGTNTASAITVASGGTLMGTGSGGATTVSGTIAPGNSPGTLTVGALTLNSGGVYTWEMADATGAAGTGWDQIASTGLLTVNSTSGSTFTIAITSSGAPSNWNYQTSNQSWDIITYGSLSGFDATKFSINATAFGGTLGGSASTWALSDTGSALRLTYTYAADPIWAAGAADWSTGFSPVITNGANATFTGAGGTATNNISSATLSSIGSITFNSTAGPYTLAADSGSSGYNAASALTLGGDIINNSTATQTINLALTSSADRVFDAASGNLVLGGPLAGTGGLTKNGTGTLTLTGNNTYTGDNTINAGTVEITTTGLLGGGSYSGNIVNTGAFLIGSNSNQTLSGVISGTGALTKNGSGTLTLAGNNNYSGNTTINTGTVVIGHANAAGTGNITQANGSSLLKIDTSGTITNNMSVYNVLATQSATLSGAITVNNATWDVETGDTLTISGGISGNGGVTKNGGGTLTLNGNNTYANATIINAGTLNAASAGALGSNTTVQVNGGTLLVSANSSINGMNITLGNNTTSTVGTLSFNSNYNGTIGALTLSANSIIDMGNYNIGAEFADLVMGIYNLSIYNWTGTTLWEGGTGVGDDDRLYFGGASDSELGQISFYSGFNSGFLGTGFDLGLSNQIIPVPEPETYATGLLLLLGGAWLMWRNRKAEGGERNAI